jgi:hypothetical protein
MSDIDRGKNLIIFVHWYDVPQNTDLWSKRVYTSYNFIRLVLK